MMENIKSQRVKLHSTSIRSAVFEVRMHELVGPGLPPSSASPLAGSMCFLGEKFENMKAQLGAQSIKPATGFSPFQAFRYSRNASLMCITRGLRRETVPPGQKPANFAPLHEAYPYGLYGNEADQLHHTKSSGDSEKPNGEPYEAKWNSLENVVFQEEDGPCRICGLVMCLLCGRDFSIRESFGGHHVFISANNVEGCSLAHFLSRTEGWHGAGPAWMGPSSILAPMCTSQGIPAKDCF